MIKCQVDTCFEAGGDCVRKDSPSPFIDFQVNRLSAAINDLSQLANFGSEVFERLVNESMGIFERVHRLSERLTTLEDRQLETKAKCDAALKGFTWTSDKNTWKSQPQMSADFFNPNSKDRSLTLLHEAADSPPALEKMDPFRSDGKESLKIYTNPQFFLETWAAKRAQEDAEKKADRKRKRMKRNKAANAQTKKRVRSVVVKKYDKMGDLIIEPIAQKPRESNPDEEFSRHESLKATKSLGDVGSRRLPSRVRSQAAILDVPTDLPPTPPVGICPSPAAPSKPMPTHVPSVVGSCLTERHASVPPQGPPPLGPPPPPSGPPPSGPPPSGPPPPPSGPPPSGSPPTGLPSSSPPPAAVAPPAVDPPSTPAVVAQPSHITTEDLDQAQSRAPAEKAPPAPALAPCPPRPENDTLEVIKPKLNTANTVAPSLLEQIQRGKILKKTEVQERKKQVDNSTVAAILARRIAIEMSDSDDDDEEDDSDDDWD